MASQALANVGYLTYTSDNMDLYVGVDKLLELPPKEYGPIGEDVIVIGQRVLNLVFREDLGSVEKGDPKLIIRAVSKVTKAALNRVSALGPQTLSTDSIPSFKLQGLIAPSPDLKILMPKDLIHAYELYIAGGNDLNGTQIKGKQYKYSFETRRGTSNLAAICLPLLTLDNVHLALGEYRNKPDEGVSFFSRQDNVTFEDSLDSYYPRSPSVVNDPIEFTREEWKALAFITAFCFTKTGDVQYLVQAVTKRLSTLKVVAALRFDIPILLGKIDVDSMATISTKVAEFPQFKKVFLTQMLSNTDVLSTHLCTILRESNLSSFCAIAKFLSAPTLTMLHIESRVLGEWVIFAEKRAKLELRYGVNTWTYHKLIAPDDQTAATTDMPWLAAAAKAWAVEIGNTTLNRLKIRTMVPPEFHQKARTHLAPQFQSRVVTLENFQKLMRGCNFPLALDKLSQAEWNQLLDLSQS